MGRESMRRIHGGFEFLRAPELEFELWVSIFGRIPTDKVVANGICG